MSLNDIAIVPEPSWAYAQENLTAQVAEISGLRISGLKVALIHDWLTGMRGGEKALDTLCSLFPDAPLWTLVHVPGSVSKSIEARKIHTSFLQHLPFAKTKYRHYLPLFPMAAELTKVSAEDADVVISTSHAVAKAMVKRDKDRRPLHVCYIHTPMRYIWELYHQYKTEAPFGAIGRLFYSLVTHYLRLWDYASAARVDYFVANSNTVKARIRKTYRMESEVIHPPVDISQFGTSEISDDFYLAVSGLSHYKRIDIAVEACSRLNRRLVVIGEGKEMASLRKLAGPSVTFLGFQPESVVRDHYRRCRAFLLPGEEDFGMTPVEAQACGKPVIAYGKGGALDTVRGIFPGEKWEPGYTGVFFDRQDVDSLVVSLKEFERLEPMFDPQAIHLHAEEFDEAHFKERLFRYIASKYSEFRAHSDGHAIIARQRQDAT